MEDQQLMDTIRDVYELVGKLVKEIRLKSPDWGPNIFFGTEFSIQVGAFIAALKKHYDLSVEDASTAKRLLDAMQNQDVETIFSVAEATVSNIHQLSDSDASGFMFHFFWPQLYVELAKSDA